MLVHESANSLVQNSFCLISHSGSLPHKRPYVTISNCFNNKRVIYVIDIDKWQRRPQSGWHGIRAGHRASVGVLESPERRNAGMNQEQAVVEKQGRPVQPIDVDKYVLNIEGTLYGWDDEKITTEQIAELGGWGPSAGVIEIDENNIEHTLAPEEVVYLKPGIEFGRKLRWKRG